MKFAMITPSYAPDYTRCKLLVESVKEHVSANVEHILLVDRKDVPMFRSLAGPRTRLVSVEDVLPWWVRRMPGARKWWLSLKTRPVRNWVLQQVVKLGVGEHVDADAYLFADSDVTFVRPFDPNTFVTPKGNLRLFRVPGAGQKPDYARWHQTAAALVGLPPSDYHGANYIGNVISWRRDNLHRLYRQIEATTGRPWAQAVCGRWHLSEYILYGVFVEHVLGGQGHAYEQHPICHVSWDYDLSAANGLDRFLGDIRPDHVAVMVHSKDGVPVERYAAALKSMRASEQSLVAV